LKSSANLDLGLNLLEVAALLNSPIEHLNILRIVRTPPANFRKEGDEERWPAEQKGKFLPHYQEISTPLSL